VRPGREHGSRADLRVGAGVSGADVVREGHYPQLRRARQRAHPRAVPAPLTDPLEIERLRLDIAGIADFRTRRVL
jgi:hypothetical protein